MWDKYVIDASLSNLKRDSFCLCPAELDDEENILSVVFGMNIIVGKEEMKKYDVIAVIHEQGQEAAEEFAAKLKGDSE